MEDYPFALATYLDSTKPLLIALGRWDEERIVSRFAEGFAPEQIEVLRANETDIGWLQVSETVDEIHLDQLHVIKGARDRGIGSRLIRELQQRAAATDRRLTLNVIRGNRAQELYKRLGFCLVGRDEEKIQMAWQNDCTRSGQSASEPAT